jgi:hypothetical protein
MTSDQNLDKFVALLDVQYSPELTANVSSWIYSRTVILDGNFKADHLHDRRPEAQIWLMDGRGYQVTRGAYHKYLAGTQHIVEVCGIHSSHVHRSIE